MKRYLIPFLFMAAAAVAACNNKAAVEEPASSEGSYIFTLTANCADGTKSDYTDAGTFKWSASDKISVLFHKDSDNKFFTLSNTSGAGETATFSGSIDSGYEIGGTDGNKWALYPAGEHKVRFSESDGEKFPLTFNIPAVTDYTASGFSAGIPMYGMVEDGNTLHFQHLGAAYKFTFSDITASKVKFVVENQTTYRLSGDVKLRNQGGTYLDQAWADGVDKTLTYISSVTDGKAVFYVPVRYYAECFKPIITLYNAQTDDQIYTKTATTAKGISSKGHVQPINISVSGAVEVPWSFPSAYGIEWNDITASVAGDTGEGYDGVVCMKAYADANNLYVYLELKQSALFDNSDYHYSNNSHLYIGNGTGETAHWAWSAPYLHSFNSWLKYNNAPRYINWNAGFVGQSTAEHKGNYCYEIAIERSSYSALSGSSATLCFEANKQFVLGEEWKGEETQIGFAPARWQEALTVALP